MAHETRIEHRGAYLYAAVSGDNTPKDVQEYVSEVRTACEAHGCSRVLIEENLRGPSLRTMDIFDIVLRGTQRSAPAVTTIAYLDVNPEHRMADLKFAENVASNRGLNIRVFADKAEAEQWLSS